MVVLVVEATATVGAFAGDGTAATGTLVATVTAVSAVGKVTVTGALVAVGDWCTLEEGESMLSTVVVEDAGASDLVDDPLRYIEVSCDISDISVSLRKILESVFFLSSMGCLLMHPLQKGFPRWGWKSCAFRVFLQPSVSLAPPQVKHALCHEKPASWISSALKTVLVHLGQASLTIASALAMTQAFPEAPKDDRRSEILTNPFRSLRSVLSLPLLAPTMISSGATTGFEITFM
jgi:hypothetical protein